MRMTGVVKTGMLGCLFDGSTFDLFAGTRTTVMSSLPTGPRGKESVPCSRSSAGLSATWIALLTAPAGAAAKVGAFTGAVHDVVAAFKAGSDRDASPLEPHLPSHVFIGAVMRRLRDQVIEQAGGAAVVGAVAAAAG